MRELSLNEIEEVNGGIFPAVYGAFVAYNLAVGYYGGATVAGFAFGAGVAGIGSFLAVQ